MMLVDVAKRRFCVVLVYIQYFFEVSSTCERVANIHRSSQSFASKILSRIGFYKSQVFLNK